MPPRFHSNLFSASFLTKEDSMKRIPGEYPKVVGSIVNLPLRHVQFLELSKSFGRQIVLLEVQGQ
jgi:hypothetical protein